VDNLLERRKLAMGIDINMIASFVSLAVIALAGPAVIFILFYRRSL
jgi:hypothetical protein